MASIGRIITAQFSSVCNLCSNSITCGQLITMGFTGRWVHGECLNSLQVMIRDLEYESSKQFTYKNYYSADKFTAAPEDTVSETCDMCYDGPAFTAGMCLPCFTEYKRLEKDMERQYYSVGMIHTY